MHVERGCILRLLFHNCQKNFPFVSISLFRYSGWKSGQCNSLISNALTNSTKKSKDIMLQKVPNALKLYMCVYYLIIVCGYARIF